MRKSCESCLKDFRAVDREKFNFGEGKDEDGELRNFRLDKRHSRIKKNYFKISLIKFELSATFI